MTDSPLFLGIDIGSSSAKGVLCTADGAIVARAARTTQVTRPRSGYSEMDAETQWWNSVVEICQELAPQAGDRLAAVAVSGVGPCVLTTDSAGNPLHPGILYGIDSRASEQINRAEETLGRANILERSGKRLSSQSAGTKLMWVHDTQPDVWAATSMWFSSHNWIGYRLTDSWYIDHHTASQYDPFYDVVEQSWAADWIAELFPGHVLPLPELVWPQTVVGSVTAASALETGLPAGVPVIAGTIDAWAEAFSVGVRGPGDLMLMYGTTMFIVQVLSAPVVQAGLWTTSGVLPSSHTLAAGMSTSGSLTNWVKELTGSHDFVELVKEAAHIRAGADGLIMLPYFAGERSPIHDPDARGTIVGLTLDHTRAHLFRAAYEGIGFAVRQVFDELSQLVGPAARIVAVGGGTQGGLWTQIISDICNVEQSIPEVAIGASYGDALLAAIGSGAVPPETDWTRVASVVAPRTEHKDVYDTLFEIYGQLYPATAPMMHALADVARVKDDVTQPTPVDPMGQLDRDGRLDRPRRRVMRAGSGVSS